MSNLHNIMIFNTCIHACVYSNSVNIICNVCNVGRCCQHVNYMTQDGGRSDSVKRSFCLKAPATNTVAVAVAVSLYYHVILIRNIIK